MSYTIILVAVEKKQKCVRETARGDDNIIIAAAALRANKKSV